MNHFAPRAAHRICIRAILCLASGLWWGGVPWASAGDLKLDADYPGGNIRLLKVEERPDGAGRLVHLAPDLRHMQEGQFWFYWSFRTREPEGFTVSFPHRNCLGTRGPAISRDGGHTWTYLGGETVRLEGEGENRRWTFTVSGVPEGGELRYAFAPQYQQSHFKSWYQAHRDHPDLKLSELVRSRSGRLVERLDIARDGGDETRPYVILTARHHCCETMGSYVLEGFLNAALAEDETGRGLRQGYRIVALPFMDKDGVEEGDQGKNRAPHDHNRDYNEKPIYPEVAALMAWGEAHGDEVVAFLDLHCPTVHGPWDKRIYFVGAPDPLVEARQMRFLSRLAKSFRGPVSVQEDDFLRFGEAWNQGTNFSQGRHSAGWARETFPRALLVSTLETPYAEAHQQEVNPDSARQLGADLARALVRHLAEESLEN